MTPQEKAQELITKYESFFSIAFSQAGSILRKEKIKQCAIIAVDEILFYLNNTKERCQNWPAFEYYQSVKQEIEKL